MKKTTKRVISLLLSVMMVVTMLPTFVITASAATDTHLIAHYFNNSVPAKSVTTNYGNGADLSAVSEDALVWNYTENAAQFKGSKTETPIVTIKDLLNNSQADFNNTNGLTITFDAKATDNSWQRFFELTTGSPYAGGSVNYLYAATNGYCRVKNMSTGDSETGGDYKMFTVTPNEWHSYKIVIGQGKLFTFVDGKLANSIDDSSRINDTFFNNLYNDGKLMLGASSWDDSAFNGYIRNFMIVDMATLDIAMAAYEAKMNGTVYTNMKPAYEAYVLAKKAAEALTYGDFESYPNPENIASDLVTKTNAMGYYDFSPYKGTVVPKANNVECYNGYSNVLYSSNSWVDGNSGDKYKQIYDGTSNNYLKPSMLGMSDIVLLYDGVNDTAFPIIFKCQTSNKSGCTNRYRWDYIASEHADWTLAKNNQTLINAKGWNTFQTSSSQISISTNTSNETNSGNNNNNKCTNEWPWQGACYYNGSGDTNNYYQTYTDAISFKGKCDIRVTWTGGSQWNENKMYTDMRYGTSGSESKTVRVINYKTLREKFNNDTRFNLSGTNYTQGGLSNLIDAYDAAALVNPVSYFTNVSNVETSVKNCANAIKNAVDTIDSANIISDSFRTITAKSGDTTLAVFNLSNGCKAKTVECALGMVTPGNGQTETTHYDYTWPATTDVDANKTYSVTRVDNPHEYADVDVQIRATCETSGVMNTKCSVCDYASTRVIPAAGHIYGSFKKDWTDYDENETTYTHSKVCNNTGCETPKVTENCSFGEWIVSEDKTTETRECSVCHGKQTREHQIDKVTVTFKLPTGKVVGSETVDPETEVNAPSLDAEAFNDAEGHHSFYWESASYVITEDITVTAIANEVEAHTTATRNINLQNVTENLVAASCAENLTYSYDLQTYCTECDYIISTVTTPVERLVHTEAIRNKDSDVHTVYCSVCLKVIEDVAHNNFTSVTSQPTCTTQGYTTYTCPCGYSYVADYTDVIAHTFGEYKYNGDNTHTRTCSVCSIDETNTCNIVAEVLEPTCIEPAYSLKHCTICPNVTEKVALDGLTEVHDIIGGYGNYIDISGNKDGEQVFDLGYDVTKMIVEIDSHTWKKNSAIVWESNAWFDIYDYNGNKVLSRNANSKQSDTITLENVRGYLRINYDLYSGSDDYIRVKSIKIIDAKYATKGHDYHYINNNDGADGLLGTHQYVCSRCNDGAGVNLEHNLDLQRSGSNIVASCKDCDFSEVLHTTASTVTLTTNNLFDTDKFILSYDATNTNKTSKGLACFRRTDGKAVVVGNGDNYTSHDRENDYLVPVEGGKTYQFDFDASTTYGDVMLFFRGAGNGYDSNYLSMRKSGTAIGTNTIEFTVPEGGKQLYIRVGTNSGDKNAYCVFSNFALHEKDDPDYTMVKDIPSGTAIKNVADIRTPSTVDFCGWYSNKELTERVSDDYALERNTIVYPKTTHNLAANWTTVGENEEKACADCGYVQTEECTFTTKVTNSGDLYTWTDHCDVNENHTKENRVVDISTYTAAIADANTEMAKTNVYTASAIEGLKAVIDADENAFDLKAESKIDQGALNAIVSRIRTATASMEKIQYTITFEYQIGEGGEGKGGKISKTENTYGEATILDLAGNVDGVDEINVIKWIVSYPDGRQAVLSNNSTSIPAYYVGNLVYTAMIAEKAEITEPNEVSRKVTLKTVGNKVSDIKYTTIDGENEEAAVATFAYEIDEVNGTGSFTINNNGDVLTFEAVKPAFYNVVGFRLTGGKQLEKIEEISLADDVSITPIYEAAQTYSITRADANIKVNGKAADYTTAAWDEKVTVTAEDATDDTVWYIDGTVAGYGKSYSFYVTKNCVVSYTNETVEKTATASVDYFIYDVHTTQAVTVTGSYSLPEGFKFVEAGMLLKTDRTTALDGSFDGTAYAGETTLDDSEWWTETIKNAPNKGGRYVATKFTTSNQFAFSVSRTATTSFIMGAVAYVTYEDEDGVEHTTYSPMSKIAYQQ